MWHNTVRKGGAVSWDRRCPDCHSPLRTAAMGYELASESVSAVLGTARTVAQSTCGCAVLLASESISKRSQCAVLSSMLHSTLPHHSHPLDNSSSVECSNAPPHMVARDSRTSLLILHTT